MESQFDNPAYGEPQHRPSTASTNALIPGGTGTGTQATVATGSQGTQAGFAAGVVMTPPPYMYDNHQQGRGERRDDVMIWRLLFLCEGNPPVINGFLTQRAGDVELLPLICDNTFKRDANNNTTIELFIVV